MTPFSIRNISFVLAIIAAGPASALSCIVPSATDAYTFAAESPENYLLGVGSLDLIGQSTPPEGAVALNGDINEMQGYTQPARFTGMQFTSSGFNQPLGANVLVQVNCIAAWCGQVSQIDNALFFFRQVSGGTYVLDVGPCPRNIIANPTGRDLRQIRNCYNNGSC